MKKTGFTLIELLIVIALLGALAIGLLATIDPFEQLKKGRDTATRNTATEFYNANLRYYGTKGNFSWNKVSFGAVTATLNATSMTTAIGDLINAGELKINFIDAAGTTRLERVVLTSTAVDQMTVCFDPESKNFALDPNTIYNSVGGSAGQVVCPGATAGTGISQSCYWCIL